MYCMKDLHILHVKINILLILLVQFGFACFKAEVIMAVKYHNYSVSSILFLKKSNTLSNENVYIINLNTKMLLDFFLYTKIEQTLKTFYIPTNHNPVRWHT